MFRKAKVTFLKIHPEWHLNRTINNHFTKYREFSRIRLDLSVGIFSDLD